MEALHIAIAGNPNSGKTTLFNRLAGTNHKVGNWAGVTVERKEGRFLVGDTQVNLVDLPGKYSLSAYSLEEKIARDYLLTEKPDIVLNVVDGTNLERHLYLTLQLLEMNLPLILVVNMVDEFDRRKVSLDLDKLSGLLGIPVVPLSAASGQGVDDLKDLLLTYTYQEPETIRFSPLIEEHIERAQQGEMERWEAIKLLEDDDELTSKYKPYALDFSDEIAEARYEVIKDLISACYEPSKNTYKFSDRLDQVALHPWLGLPVFAGVMALVFYLTFSVGNIFVDYLDLFFNNFVAVQVKSLLESLSVMPLLVDLVVDGIIGGVGGVLTFVPNIAILFFFISLLEDTGYMARAAYIMDRYMQRIGLNGKFFIPMLVGFGCNVPAIMSTRTLDNEKDRLLAILINPFMSCGARFPVYVLFAGVFFKGAETLVVFSLYVLGILVAILAAYLLRKTVLKGEISHLLMELPEYRLPSPRNLLSHVWEKVRGYIVKAGTVIFVASVIIWFVLNFNLTGRVPITESFGAMIGRFIAPVFTLSGFGNWESALSLLSGIFAKEIVVSNTAIIYGLGESATLQEIAQVVKTAFTPLSAYSFMIFVLLYTPCVAVMGVIRRETNSWKWLGFSILFQLTIALLITSAFYQLGLLIVG